MKAPFFVFWSASLNPSKWLLLLWVDRWEFLNDTVKVKKLNLSWCVSGLSFLFVEELYISTFFVFFKGVVNESKEVIWLFICQCVWDKSEIRANKVNICLIIIWIWHMWLYPSMFFLLLFSLLQLLSTFVQMFLNLKHFEKLF